MPGSPRTQACRGMGLGEPLLLDPVQMCNALIRLASPSLWRPVLRSV